MARVFISHASADLDSVDQVRDTLHADGHTVSLDQDLHDGSEIGQGWRQRLRQELRHADAVVCVVTAAFNASSWCAAEVGIADALGCRLLPVRAEEGATHPLLAHLQFTDYHADPPAALDQLVRTLRRLGTGGRHWREADEGSPFPGLRAFTGRMASMFFGRDRETRELTDRLRASATAGTGLLAVTGPSGCGKSSLVRAGLLPRLADDPDWLVVEPFTPGGDPVAAVASPLATAAGQVGLEELTPDAVRVRLAGDDGLELLAEELLAPGRPDERRVLLVVDQAEELFTRTGKAEREQFARLLRAAVAGRVQVVATLRSEFLDDLRALPELDEVDIDSYLVRPLTPDALRLVIEEPARAAGLGVDTELVDRLVADTWDGEALPLLAFTLEQLARGRQRGETLATEDYDRLGGVRGAVATQASAALATATTATGTLTEREIVTGLVGLVTVDEHGRYSTRRVRRSDFPERMKSSVDEFVDRRLLTSEHEERDEWVEVAHEALLSSWQPLIDAIGEQAAMLQAVRSVERAAAEWESNRRAESHLWDEERLNATELALRPQGAGEVQEAGQQDRLSPEAQVFLEATRRRVTARRVRRRRISRGVTTGLSTLLAVATVAAVVAFRLNEVAQEQRRIAEQGQRTATSRQLASLANGFRDSDPRLSALLSAAAWRVEPTAEARSAVLGTQGQRYITALPGIRGAGINNVSFSPDGSTLATAGADETVWLWDIENRTKTATLEDSTFEGHAEGVHNAVFSPDGATLATAGWGAPVKLWDAKSHAEIATLEGTSEVYDLAFSPDGTLLAIAGWDETVRLWDLRSHREIAVLEGHTNTVTDVTFSPDGSILATACQDKRVRLWDVRSHTLITAIGSPADFINDLAFSPDGSLLAIAESNNAARLWDVEHNRELAVLQGHTNTVEGVAFSPDGRVLATGSWDGTVRLWDVSSQTAITTFTGYSTNEIAFSPDGTMLAAATRSGDTILWNTCGLPLAEHTDDINGLAFSPDGSLLATAGNDFSTRIWDVENHTEVAAHESYPKSATGVRFSPDGSLLATLDLSTAYLWNAEDHTAVIELLKKTGTSFGDAAFKPDGTLLVTTTSDGWVQLWGLEQGYANIPGFRPYTVPTYGLAFSPDGATLAISSWNGTTKLWDMESNEEIATLDGHTDIVSDVAFSPDGTMLATSSDDTTVRLWDARRHTTIDVLEGHTGSVNSVMFSPDGSMLVTSGDDDTVRIWDVGRGIEIATLQGNASFHAAVFSSDGTRVAGGGEADIVRFWDIDANRVLDQICGRLQDNLTRDEWARFVPDLPYRKVCP